MVEVKRKQDSTGIEHFYRDGIELNKGFELTEDFILKNLEPIKKLLGIFTVYPDLYIDLITPVESHFQLYFYQRIFLRACMRYRYNFCCAPRAFSKTFLSILAMVLRCIFLPGSKVFICAPTKQQGAKVAKEKVEEILDKFPLLRKELVKDNYTSGTDYLRMAFRNGSIFDIVAAIDSTRGGRRHSGIIDETRDHDADTLNEIVLPLLNVDRRTKAGLVNPKEPQQTQIYITSAGTRSSYAYNRLIELFENSIVSPKTSFTWGCDYRVPMLHGLLNKQYLNEIKMSTTYKDESFSREYLSKWTGGGNDSWFDYDRLTRYRKLINPENSQKNIKDLDFFYLLSVDVGRINCQTVVTVFKVIVREEDAFFIRVVNIYILGKTEERKHFSIQALDLKKIIAAFNPKEVVVDANGLGAGLMDALVLPSYDDTTNQYYPGYCAFNNDQWRQSLYPQANPIIYAIKVSNSLDSEIHGNCYSKIYSGKVHFLAPEQEIKSRLLESKVGQKMKIEQRVARVQPHELTTRLFEEMSNFKLKPSMNGKDIKLEKINSRILSDKFSSLEYGLWRIKEIEDTYYSKRRRKGGLKRKLVYFTEGA